MIIDSLGSPKAIIESRARAWSDTVKDCLTESTWKSYTEQERRHFIEEIENA